MSVTINALVELRDKNHDQITIGKIINCFSGQSITEVADHAELSKLSSDALYAYLGGIHYDRSKSPAENVDQNTSFNEALGYARSLWVSALHDIFGDYATS